MLTNSESGLLISVIGLTNVAYVMWHVTGLLIVSRDPSVIGLT